MKGDKSLVLMEATADKLEGGVIMHYGVPIATVGLAEAATRLTHWTEGEISLRKAQALLLAVFAPVGGPHVGARSSSMPNPQS